MTDLVYIMRIKTAIAIFMVRYAWQNDYLRLQRLSSDAQDPHRPPVQCGGFSLSSKADPAPVKQTLQDMENEAEGKTESPVGYIFSPCVLK